MAEENEEKSVISNQRDARYAKCHFGRKGNVGHHGCGAIAVYNVNQLLGIGESFGDVLKEFNKASRNPIVNPTLLGGLLGGNPFYMRKYYKDKGYHARWRFRTSQVSKNAKAYIFLVIYKKPFGGHYQAGVYRKRCFEVYNGNHLYDTVEAFYKSDKNNFFMMVLEIS